MSFIHNTITVPWLVRVVLTLWLLTLLVTLTIFLSVAPFVLFGTIVVFFCGGSVLSSSLFLLVFPFTLCLCTKSLRDSIRKEKSLCDQVGYARLLWFDQNPTGYGRVLRPVVMQGWDLFIPTLWKSFLPLIPGPLRSSMPEDVSTEEIASITWGWLVDALDWATFGPNVGGFLLLLMVLRRAFLIHVLSVKLFWKILRFFFLGLFFVWMTDAEFVVLLLDFIVRFFAVVTSRHFFSWLKWRLTHAAVVLTVFALDASTVSMKYTPVAFSQLKGKSGARTFSALFRERLMQATVMVSDLGLPHYIRGTRPHTKAGLQESLSVLSELGWPVNVQLTDEIADVTIRNDFVEWLICGSDWQQGIHNLKLWTDHLLDDLRTNAIEFRRTEEYATEDNELLATARYFKSPRYDFPDLDLDDVWFLVKDTFKHSRLTPFNYIIRMWEKKYGLGAFFRRPGTKGKLSRKDFIKSIGGLGPFKQLWRRTFEYATVIVPVSAVSVKGEALPPKKWAADKVRTIIGTPLVHYIMSTIWNYEPNHRFAWVSTPTKIGMPLNGYWIADLYHRHSRCQHHFAGDMSDFDSTISGKVSELIKGIRKKGYEEHRDHARICDLIDVAYDQLDGQLLNLTSTGQIYRKGTGLTTGHSSTSADNSLALAILYLLAWKELTGLSSREFVHFNELSDYGDDHVLSYLATKPAAWNFKNIQKVMARWGVTNNLEASGPLSAIPFLSKWSRKMTNEDRRVLNSHHVPLPKRIVWHDKDRLVGKMVAKVKNKDPRYRAKRLLSYLSLTAHHEDVYIGIKKVLTRSSTMKRAMKEMKATVPSYGKVLRDWYNPSTHSVTDVFDETSTDATEAGLAFNYGNVTWLDSFLGSISMVPDFVNPAIFNFGYDRLLQLQMRRWLSWPVEFLSEQNSIMGQAELRQLLSRTVYSSLIADVHVRESIQYDPGAYLLRHWAFLAYKYASRKVFSPPWLAGINMKVSQLQFALNGTVVQDTGVFDWKLADLLIISALNLVPLSEYLAFVSTVVLPRLDLIWNAVTGYVVGMFWTNVPPNYKDVTHLLRRLPTLGGPLLVEAPTGTGKSTSFVKHVSLVVGHAYDKIIVIEPRSVLVKSLVPFVRDSLLVDATGRTSGFDFDRTRKVWYVTAQEALLHKNEILNDNNLVILDEAHIDEAAYSLVSKILSMSAGINSVLLTATPTESNVNLAVARIPLVIASVWQVKQNQLVSEARTVSEYLKEYENLVLDRLSVMQSVNKTLVFHPSKDRGENLGDRCGKKFSLLNSNSQDTTQNVIISTSVADAGITIPSVDLVISPCIDFVGGGFNTPPKMVKVDPFTLAQRKGRTGRTNNGSFICLLAPNLDLPVASVARSNPAARMSELLSAGVSIELLHSLDSDMVVDGLGLSLTQSAEVKDKTLETISRLLKNAKYWQEARVLEEAQLADIPQADVIFDYTAAGVASVSSLLSIEDALSSFIAVAKGASLADLGLDYDATSLLASLRKLSGITALQAPLLGFVPFEVAIEVEPDLDRTEHNFFVQSVNNVK